MHPLLKYEVHPGTVFEFLIRRWVLYEHTFICPRPTADYGFSRQAVVAAHPSVNASHRHLSRPEEHNVMIPTATFNV